MKALFVLLSVPFGIAVPPLFAGAAAPVSTPKTEVASGLSPAEAALHVLDDRLHKILTDAEKAGDNLDEDRLKLQMQQLAYAYDDFLKKYPAYAPGFASYGTMLGKIDMRKESAAMFLKADTFFMNSAKQEGARTPAFDKTWALTKNQLGNFVAEEGKPLDAVGYFLAAIDLVPTEPLYHYQLGSLLSAARDDFLKSGSWTREALDNAMHEAFRKAWELAPKEFAFGYRYGESFNDMEHPDWDGALKVWGALEDKAESDIERQTLRLQAANVLVKQQKFDAARALLGAVTVPELDGQKQKLVAQLPSAGAK